VVVADHELLHTEPSDEDLLHEAPRRVAGQRCGEGEEDGIVESTLSENLLLLEGRGQHERRVLRPEDTQGVRIERDQDAAPAGVFRSSPDFLKYAPVPQMHPVECPDRRNRAAIRRDSRWVRPLNRRGHVANTFRGLSTPASSSPIASNEPS
jgi:hypothetical protein